MSITCVYKSVMQQAYACKNVQAHDKERRKLSMTNQLSRSIRRETPVLHKPQSEL